VLPYTLGSNITRLHQKQGEETAAGLHQEQAGWQKETMS
jgi:hypothetical protein